MKRFTWLLVGMNLSMVPVPVRSQPQYFPLEVGNRWTYVIEHAVFSGGREVSVESEEGGLFRVRTRSSGPGADVVVSLRVQDDDVFIELEQDGLVPYYRFGEDS